MSLSRKVLVDEYRTIVPATSLENSLDGNGDLPLTSGKEGGCAMAMIEGGLSGMGGGAEERKESSGEGGAERGREGESDDDEDENTGFDGGDSDGGEDSAEENDQQATVRTYFRPKDGLGENIDDGDDGNDVDGKIIRSGKGKRGQNKWKINILMGKI
eukprot:evm.model.NODE_18784_length_12911_cov_19.438231.4